MFTCSSTVNVRTILSVHSNSLYKCAWADDLSFCTWSSRTDYIELTLSMCLCCGAYAAFTFVLFGLSQASQINPIVAGTSHSRYQDPAHQADESRRYPRSPSKRSVSVFRTPRNLVLRIWRPLNHNELHWCGKASSCHSNSLACRRILTNIISVLVYLWFKISTEKPCYLNYT